MIEQSNLKQLKIKLKKEVIDSGVLNVKYIEDQLNKNPAIYLYYPYLFKDAFNISDSEKILNLSVGGFLHYLNIIHSDYIIDTDDKNKLNGIEEKLTIIQSLTEQSIRIFTEIFPKSSLFWNFWKKRKKEYVNTYLKENKLSYDSFSIEEYSKLADDKVAFAKSAIDACYIMGGTDRASESNYNSLLESHKNFSIGYQICDDINDIKKDIEDSQFNYALYRCKKEKLFSDEKNITIEEFYYSSLIIEIYKEAIFYFKKALDCLNDQTKKTLWKKLVDFKVFETSQKIETLNQYNKINIASERLSTQHFFLNKSHISNHDLDSSISRAINFIFERLAGNYWEEYITQAGISTYWATAFIGLYLNPISQYEPNLKKAIHRAKEYIKHRKNNLWSFNDKWKIIDSDSTNFSILFSNLRDKNILEEWFTFQRANGGFSTYNKESSLEKFFVNEPFESFEGWYSSHVCVSSVSAHVLHPLKDSYLKQWNRLINFLYENQTKDGFWESYWWGHPIYSTYYCYSLFSKKEKNNEILNKTNVWLMDISNKDGSISDIKGKSSFFTGLLLKTYLNNLSLFSAKADKTALFLMKNQFADGSWSNSHSLQIPSPEILKPTEYKDVKTFGVNIRAREYQRLFSTVVCLNALYSYKLKQDLI